MFASRDIFAVSLAALLISQPAGAVGPEAAGSPDVELLLRQIRSTLIRVQGEIAERRLPELKDILITLQTGIKTAGGGKISFFVVSLGDTVSNERVQTLKITLTPAKVSSAQVSASQDFSRDFANAIIAVAETVASSSAQKPELNLSNLSASIKFVSESHMEGGLEKVQLLPVSLDLSGSINPTNTHEAILNFGSSADRGKEIGKD